MKKLDSISPAPDQQCEQAGAITQLLLSARAGDLASTNELYRRIFSELKIVAKSHRRKWNGAQTINTTSLVNEAYLKLADYKGIEWQCRAQFFCVAGKAMRQILINYARDSNAVKRGQGLKRVTLDEAVGATRMTGARILDLEAALRQLESKEPRLGRVIECRFFAGLNVSETAEATGLSTATVKRDVAIAKAWLSRALR